MGQAFRRATGRIAGSRVDTAPQVSKPIHQRKPEPPPPPPPPPPPAAPFHKPPTIEGTSEDASRVNLENVLEVRDPQFDVMLSQMVGKIRTKPGGKFEMSEASVVEKYQRPLPKLRNTKPYSDRYEERPAPPGTLNVVQVREIILLHQGKSVDHAGPMDIPRIAELFRVDTAQVQNILKFVTLPPEDESRRKTNQE